MNAYAVINIAVLKYLRRLLKLMFSSNLVVWLCLPFRVHIRAVALLSREH
jgi:hypothetical protein